MTERFLARTGVELSREEAIESLITYKPDLAKPDLAGQLEAELKD